MLRESHPHLGRENWTGGENTQGLNARLWGMLLKLPRSLHRVGKYMNSTWKSTRSSQAIDF